VCKRFEELMVHKDPTFSPLTSAIVCALRHIVDRQQAEKVSRAYAAEDKGIDFTKVFRVWTIFDEPEMQELLHSPLLDAPSRSQLVLTQQALARFPPSFPEEWVAYVA
jgi:hypothetical protein